MIVGEDDYLNSNIEIHKLKEKLISLWDKIKFKF